MGKEKRFIEQYLSNQPHIEKVELLKDDNLKKEAYEECFIEGESHLRGFICYKISEKEVILPMPGFCYKITVGDSKNIITKKGCELN